MKDPSQRPVGAKGLRDLEGPHRPTPEVRLKLLSRSLRRETSWSCWDMDGAEILCGPTGAQKLHLSVKSL